ncbi:MAG: hypothetical protein QM503_15430 [Bacteroidota bacterium]
MRKKILIIIIGIVLLVVIAIFSFRHIIVGHALKITISKKTNQTISLDIGEVYYDILNSSVSFSNSELLFNNTFLNEEKTIELSELKFDQVKIDNLSILRLIFKREVVADKFTVAKPSLWFMKNNNPQPFKEKPKEIIKSLKKHHDILKNLTVIVGEIEITHGKIDLKSIINNEEHSGSVEFKLLLKKINTSNKQDFDEDKILFAEEHFVKLSKFNYTMPNGDNISFDSVVFDSKLNNLITSNIKVLIKSGSAHSKINPITAHFGEVRVSGINFEAIENLHDIEVDSIEISDGHLLLTDNYDIKSTILTDTTKHDHSLFNEFKRLRLNSFILNNINLLNNDHNGDTILNLENFNLLVNEIELDSASLANKVPNIDYNSILVSSGIIKVFDKKSGMNITLNSFNFNEKAGVILLKDLQINDHSKVGSKNFTSSIAAINISGISAKSIAVHEPMKIALDIVSPTIDINLRKSLNKASGKKDINLENIEISEINISKGNIHILENEKLDVKITEFNFNSGKIKLTDFTKIHEVNSDSMVFSSSSLAINLMDRNMKVSSGSFTILNNRLKINDISTNIIENKVNASVSINQLELSGYNVKEIINHKIINVTSFKIIRPKIIGSLFLTNDNDIESGNKPQLENDYRISINNFEIVKGIIDLDINLKNDKIKIGSGVDISIADINIADGKDTTWKSEILWKINFLKPVVHYQDYLISIANIESDKEKEILSLNNIEIKDNLKSKSKSGVDIRELTIDNIHLSGLNYNTIINKQKLKVKSITIKNPYFNVMLANYHHKKTKQSHGQLNKSSLPLDIDDIEINNLSFKIEAKDSTSITNMSLGNLDFSYNMSVRNNIMDGLNYFNAVDFVYTDTLKNSFALIKNISYSINNENINISGIEGGSIQKQIKSDSYLHYSLSDLNINGIEITQTYPHNINFDNINIDDFKLNLESHDVSSGIKKPSKKKKKIIFPKFINTLNISTISGDNFDIDHLTISDTSVKKLVLNKIYFLIHSIKIDSNTFDNNNFVFADSLSVRLNNNYFISKDSLYATSINNITYNFIDNKLTIDTLLMKPRFKTAEFFKKAIYQIGMMNISTNRIICSNIRFEKLIKHGDIHIGSIDTYGLEMFIFRNKKYEMNPNVYKKMPQEALLSMNKVLTIDSLKTHDSYIQYKQLSEKSVIPGVIFLDKVNLSVFNINNDLKVIDNTSSMVAIFKAQLLGESPTDLKMTFPILSPAHDFWVSGSVDNVDFTKLNSMTQNLVGVTLKKGTGELEIPLISGNSEHSEGSINFKYKKLKIELYDREKAQNAKGLGGNMANLLLNDILIKSNNPGFLGKTRTGEVYFKRNTQKSIVSYTWKSILSGIMSTMGFNNKEQRQEKRAIKRKRK